MQLAELAVQNRVDPFTDEDRIMHTTKLVERTFGVQASELGRVELKDGAAVLVFSHGGAEHRLSWARPSRGGVVWYLDGSDEPLRLGGSDRSLARLVAAVDR